MQKGHKNERIEIEWRQSYGEREIEHKTNTQDELKNENNIQRRHCNQGWKFIGGVVGGSHGRYAACVYSSFVISFYFSRSTKIHIICYIFLQICFCRFLFVYIYLYICLVRLAIHEVNSMVITAIYFFIWLLYYMWLSFWLMITW